MEEIRTMIRRGESDDILSESKDVLKLFGDLISVSALCSIYTIIEDLRRIDPFRPQDYVFQMVRDSLFFNATILRIPETSEFLWQLVGTPEKIHINIPDPSKVCVFEATLQGSAHMKYIPYSRIRIENLHDIHTYKSFVDEYVIPYLLKNPSILLEECYLPPFEQKADELLSLTYDGITKIFTLISSDPVLIDKMRTGTPIILDTRVKTKGGFRILSFRFQPEKSPIEDKHYRRMVVKPISIDPYYFPFVEEPFQEQSMYLSLFKDSIRLYSHILDYVQLESLYISDNGQKSSILARNVRKGY
jgi:hypothetical protein